MDLNLNVTVMGVREGARKDGTTYYRADLYLPGVGPFDVSVEPGEYVSLSKIPSGSALVLYCKVAISDRTVAMPNGKSFTVKALSLNTGKLAIPENARKVA